MQFALKAKNAIRKIAAISAGTVMLGATITGAMAYSLADYPAPFVSGGRYDMLPVYGDRSLGDDIAGAWDILGGMSASAVSPGTGGTGSTVVVSGGETDEIPINGTLITSGGTTFMDSQLEDDDIESFQDTEISFAGGSYDVHDELDLGQVGTGGAPNPETAPQIVTGLTSGDDDYESNIYMESATRAISYHYVFDESIVLNDTSTTTPLEIMFLGKKLKIVSIDAADKFTAYVGDEYFMNVGDKVTSEGKTVTLENVGQSSVLIDVDGVKATIPSGATELVNGVEITVDELFYRTQIEASSATLVVGKDSSEAIENEDFYFGGDGNCLNNDPDDPDCWRWRVDDLYAGGSSGATGNIYVGTEASGDAGPTIGIESRFVINDDKDNPPTIGDCINLPNNYASICLDSLSVADTDYNTFEIRYESDVDLSNADNDDTSEKVIIIEALEGLEEGIVIESDTFDILGSDFKTDKIYLRLNESTTGVLDLFYEDSDNKIQFAGSEDLLVDGATIGYIEYQDTKGTTGSGDDLMLTYNGSGTGLFLHFDIGSKEGIVDGYDDIYLQLHNATATVFDGFGETIEDAEAEELQWGQARKTIGTKDEDHRTMYGIIIKDPKSSLGTDSLELEIPADQVMANIVIKGTSTQVTSSSASGVVSDTPPPMVKASEVSNPEADNLLIVGGPVVNAMAARFVGSDWAYKPGEAIIELKDNGAKVALVVAGTDAVDTRRAARVLRDFNLWSDKLVGKAVKVTGTSSTFTDTVLEAKA